MHTIEIILVALALSIDAGVVAMAAAAAGKAQDGRAQFRLSFHFGLFQFLMPVLGWSAGTTLEPIIAPVDHWIAFGLLVLVGGHMVRSGLGASTPGVRDDPSKGLTLIALATATSIDALAVGLTLAILDTGIWLASLIIGLIAGSVSFAGIILGNRVHVRFGSAAEVIGGLILMIIAVRIVIIHLSA
jgi:putative Mn2+ efflux pump MntP